MMKQLKSLWIGILCFSMLTLTGCSENEHGLDSDNPIKITMWHYYSSSQKNSFDKLITEFNASEGKDKGIVVEAISQGGVNELETNLMASAQKDVGAAEMPDMFSAYASSAQLIDGSYGLADLNQYISKSDREEYIDAYIEEGYVNHDERLLLFPVAKATELLFVNKTAWDEFSAKSGVTTTDMETWEGLAKVAEKYYTYSNGKAFFGRDAMANYILSGTKQLEDDLFKVEDGNVTLQANKTTMRKLWDNYYIPYVEGYYLNNGKYASDDLKTSDIIAYVGSTSSSTFFPTSVSQNESETKDIDYMVLPVPNFADHEAIATQQGAGVAVTKNDETHEYACVTFLRWLTDAQRNLDYAADTGYMPVKKNATYDMLEEEQLQNMKPIVKDTLSISMKQVEQSQLYTYAAFKGSNTARSIIDTTLKQKAKQDRIEIETAIANGEDPKTIIASYTNDENFATWYADFVKALQKAIE